MNASVDHREPPKEQLDALLQRELPDLIAYARLLTRNRSEADDLCQEVCLEVIKRPELLLAGDRPGAYLRGIARHLCSRVSALRPRHAALDEAIDEAWDQAEMIDQDPDAALASLRRCMESLSPRARELLDHRYRDGTTAVQLAKTHGMGVDAVRMALLRARDVLARCLGQRGVRI